ncbi:hypothetical protein PROFUN_12216 [Planoprotostelium fungivorum]|uniref:Sushi domain-containing protein n=1 Tax=Planoprotostelium fungivorum TaxID=1890364 RepID=A0A2P6N860_9EUKA|nr:hypothetical protein PROFUN_12216 [Planoprotostelium fungivorum]
MRSVLFIALVAFALADLPAAPESFRLVYKTKPMDGGSTRIISVLRDSEQQIQLKTDVFNFASTLINVLSATTVDRYGGKCNQYQSFAPLVLQPLYTVKPDAVVQNSTCTSLDGSITQVSCYDGTFWGTSSWARVCFDQRTSDARLACATVGNPGPGSPDVITIVSLNAEKPEAGEFLQTCY